LIKHVEIMTDTDYLDRAEALLKAVEACVDHINDNTDADLDAQRTGGMITLEFANKSQIILNLQKPLHEVWMAAKSGGYHYKLNDGQWRCTRRSTEFFSDLSREASVQAGQTLAFTAQLRAF
jgi:CyaY protein